VLVDLYFAKDGRRYRSLGDKDITSRGEHGLDHRRDHRGACKHQGG
jgi:hypothetical protein